MLRIKIHLCYSLILVTFSATGQVMTENDIIAKALNQHPSIALSQFEIQKQKSLERTAFNPAQPLFTFETPSDIGLAFEIEQQIEFPSVYSKRSKWLKSLTELTTEEAVLTKNQLIREIRMAYLEAQLAQSKTRFYQVQDSLWDEIASLSERLFNAGEINRADLLFAENQSGIMHNKLANAQTETDHALLMLSLFAGETVLQVDDLSKSRDYYPEESETYYFDDYIEAAKHASENEVNMWKAKRLPDFVFGYLRSPERDTDFRFRYKLGLTIPIWQGQYNGEVESGKADLMILESESDLRRRQALTSRLQWQSKLDRSDEALQWFEANGLPQMNNLVNTYIRLYEGGEIDYTLALRNIMDALQLQDQYLETLAQHHTAVIQLQFLSGE